MRFENRLQAGQILAQKLQPWAPFHPLVLALPRGGVPVAFEIAKSLRGQLDVLLVKKIGVPGHEELAVGALAESGEPFWNAEILATANLSKARQDILVAEKSEEIREQKKRWRADREAIPVQGRTVILVDDGLATGATMIAAIECLKRQNPSRIVVAVPVGSREAVATISELVDAIEIAHVPERFRSVGSWYRDFRQVQDEEVRTLLRTPLGSEPAGEESDVVIDHARARLKGRLTVPAGAEAMVLFAHGSGSTHKSPRNQRVAAAFHQAGIGTLLFDLLTEEEARNRAQVFNIELLAERLLRATEWLRERQKSAPLPIGYFGASTGAAAALGAAARDHSIFAVVSRGGRPDLAGEDLARVKAPTLLIVGGDDTSVIPLNQKARKKLRKAEIVIIPDATHLFEEPGAMEKVTEYALDWFLRSFSSIRPEPTEEIISEVREIARPLRDDEDLNALVRSMSSRRVVMLGESTHGTEDFYEIRKVISQKLLEDYGFSFIAVEGDWPDCYELNRFVRAEGAATKALDVMKNFRRWPLWMWANQQVDELIEWMRLKPYGFYGLDVYSLNESLAVLKSYVDRVDKNLAQKILDVYACFEPFQKNEIGYAKVLMHAPQSCVEEAVECLREMTRTRLEDTSLDHEQLFDAKQNALILQNAERYYRAMASGDAESWNIRDEHMLTTLEALLRHYGEGAKGIVWAHNTHIGDYRATDMADEGYVNLGGLARERFGEESVYLLGFGTYEGEVIAGQGWERAPEIMGIPQARPESLEHYLHEIARDLKVNRFFFEMKDGLQKYPGLNRTRGHRAIGVVYQPRFEAHGRNYVPTRLVDRYDGFVFVDRSKALRALRGREPDKNLFPETWPLGQ